MKLTKESLAQTRESLSAIREHDGINNRELDAWTAFFSMIDQMLDAGLPLEDIPIDDLDHVALATGIQKMANLRDHLTPSLKPPNVR